MTTKRVELLFAVREMPQIMARWEEEEEHLRGFLDAPSEPNERLSSLYLSRIWTMTKGAEFVHADNVIDESGDPIPGATAAIRKSEIIGVVCKVSDVEGDG